MQFQCSFQLHQRHSNKINKLALALWVVYLCVSNRSGVCSMLSTRKWQPKIKKILPFGNCNTISSLSIHLISNYQYHHQENPDIHKNKNTLILLFFFFFIIIINAEHNTPSPLSSSGFTVRKKTQHSQTTRFQKKERKNRVRIHSKLKLWWMD